MILGIGVEKHGKIHNVFFFFLINIKRQVRGIIVVATKAGLN